MVVMRFVVKMDVQKIEQKNPRDVTMLPEAGNANAAARERRDPLLRIC